MDYQEYGTLMYQSAEAYSKAAKHLNAISSQDMALLLPSQVNASLSLELYFKSLYYFEFNREFKVKERHSHDFHKLFLELPSDLQSLMKNEFQALLAKRNMRDAELMEIHGKVKAPRDLVTNLENWSSVFVKIRYFFDKPQKTIIMMFFPEIEVVVKQAIRDVKPNLKLPA
jgi:hypothetical protein